LIGKFQYDPQENQVFNKFVYTFVTVKKILVAILAIVYISTSVGATVHVHYCMGKMANWGFGQNEAKTCSKCGMEQSEKKGNGCCKDENKFIKNNADQKTAAATLQMAHLIAVDLPVSIYAISIAGLTTVTEENPVSNAPPRSSGVAVYIRNCVFRL